MEKIFSKAFISGDYFEYYSFKTPIKKSKAKQTKDRRDLSDSEKLANRHQSLVRIRKNLKRFLYCNTDLLYFWTFTFRDNVDDIDCANRLFKKFIQRLRYKYPDIKYIAVVEFQKRGAVHYHVVLNQRVDFYEMSGIWRYGFCLVKRVNNRRHLVNYVLKYLKKVSPKDRRLWGKKVYHTSRNLNKPEDVTNMSMCDFAFLLRERMAKNWLNVSNFKVRSGSFVSDYVGEVQFWVFDLSPPQFESPPQFDKLKKNV